MKIAVEIEWDWPINPADKHWLCADNIALALHSYCRNTKFVVHESTADVAALKAENAALKADIDTLHTALNDSASLRNAAEIKAEALEKEIAELRSEL